MAEAYQKTYKMVTAFLKLKQLILKTIMQIQLFVIVMLVFDLYGRQTHQTLNSVIWSSTRVCLRNLRLSVFQNWRSFIGVHGQYSPLSFGSVVSLKELHLVCGATHNHKGFNLSELLCGISKIHTLTLDFQGEKVFASSFCMYFHQHR